MKYYEVSTPKYFLIKANNLTGALRKYLSVLDYMEDDDRECCQGMLERFKELESEVAYQKYIFNVDLSVELCHIDNLLEKFFSKEEAILLQK